MTTNERQGRLIFGAIAAVIAIAVGILVWTSIHLQDRRRQLVELSLKQDLRMLHVRLDGFFHEMAEDLREEASSVGMPDSLLLMERWFPLLDTHWPILSIRLADEHGNELAVERRDTSYVVSRTAEGCKDGPPILLAFSTVAGHPIVRGAWIGDADNDPREGVWFSKALEDTRNEPIWTLSLPEGHIRPMLQPSYLIRTDSIDGPYRIITFTVDMSRTGWLDRDLVGGSSKATLLADDVGRSMLAQEARDTTMGNSLRDAALQAWVVNKTKAPFDVRMGGHDHQAIMGPYALNGQQLNTGVVTHQGAMEQWLRAERVGLVTAWTIMATLILLLMMAWFRKRSSDERLRKEARRSRSQELKLAKALGEREVLNREVHHRVKNNLQVVSSLLNLQASRVQEGVVRSEFLRGKRRIDTIALVHHKLYGLADLRNIDLQLFFTEVVQELAGIYAPESRTISHEVDTSGIMADQDTAIELGIILCELVGNSYRHAFPYATGGHVEIKVQRVKGDLLRLTVKDNGTGMAEGATQRPGTLGLEIVEALSEQLDGSFHVRTGDGTQFEVLFRMKHGPASMMTEGQARQER